MVSRIIFLTSAHDSFDDRIFYHLAKTLSLKGYTIQVTCSKNSIDTTVGDIHVLNYTGEGLSKINKIKAFQQILEDFKPDLIICSEPLPIIAAKGYTKKTSSKIKIIYDVTEWYSLSSGTSAIFFIRPLRYLVLFLFNIWATRYTDAFIFGEKYKSIIYRILFPLRPRISLGYYPDLKYIDHKPAMLDTNNISLCYTGELSIIKGFGHFLRMLDYLGKNYGNIKITAKIVGRYAKLAEKKYFQDIIGTLGNTIEIIFFEYQKYPEFSHVLQDTNIFFDLRRIDLWSYFCMPIKIFYYAACGRPVIFFNNRSIKKEVEIKKFGYLVNSSDYKGIAEIIVNYLNNSELYYLHCTNARELALTKYNWSKIEPGFVKFIERQLKDK